MSSILTNNSAMVALQTLKMVNANLAGTQNEISTGKSVANAKDNAAIWAISKVMESDVESFKGVSDSLSLGQSTVAVARQGAETITDLLTQMKTKIVAAQEENVDRETIQADIDALQEQITTVVDAAQFNGLNLLDGTSSADMEILSSLNRSSDGSVAAGKIDVARQNLSIDGTATSQVYGNTATDQAGANAYIQAGATDTNFAVATEFDDEDSANTRTGVISDAGNIDFTISTVSEGVGYSVLMDDLVVNLGGGGTTDEAQRTFQYVAKDTDSAVDVARELADQINEFFAAATPDGFYTVTVDPDSTGDETVFRVTNASGVDINLFVEATEGGTPGNADGLGGLSAVSTIDVTSDAGATSALTAIDDLIETAIDAAAAFGSAQSQIETQAEFMSNLTDALKTGIGSLVDADMEEASARLQALQVQQQLAVQALSIANQAPQSILSLFR